MTNLQNYSAFDYKGTCGIYKICIKNHIYVGSSKVLKNRLRNHYNSLKNGKHFSKFLQSCVNKYTMEETFFDILEYCVEGDLAERETYYIQHLKADINQIYDVVRLKRTEECSRRQSARQKEYYKTHRPVNCKKVYVYDPYGNFYKEFDSAAKTAKFFNVEVTNVTSSIKKGSLCLMYRCSYVKHEKLPSLQYAQIVKQFDKFGNLVKV